MAARRFRALTACLTALAAALCLGATGADASSDAGGASSEAPALSAQAVREDGSQNGAGNPTTYRDDALIFNADNQRSATGFAFDGNGSPTAYAGATMTWDEEARLKTVSSTGAYRWYGTRSDGLRAWKDSATSVPQGGGTPTSTAKYFYYDGGKPVLETDASGTVTAINVFAPDGLVARWGGSSWRYYQFDQQGSVVHRLKADGTLDNSSMYECYGQYVNVPQYIGADCWRWNGRWGYYYDSETGLYLCGQRYVDPGQGRWLNRDPIGYEGGANLYGYCDGNPIGAADPEGLRWVLQGKPGRGKSWDIEWIWIDPWRRDPEGYMVYVGVDHDADLFSRINLKGNAMTISGYTRIHDEEDYELYLKSSRWRKHEHWHIEQENCYGAAYLPMTIIGYVSTLSHDNAPMEIDAYNAAGYPYRDPMSGPAYPIIPVVPLLR
ncbi:MAG: RHS repeat-associated core domain-containing protein [Armatimonadetes bacterium]|nr:RHS repeat-associated core domain-containing protein [Armatimonadota bacterium]